MVEHRRVLKAFMDRLLVAIREPQSLCWDLYARGLISKRTLTRITSPESADYESRKAIMDSVSSLVSVDSSKLMDFLLILEEHPPADQISMEMREKLLTKVIIVDEAVHREFELMKGRLGGLIRRVKNAAVDAGVTLGDMKEFLYFTYPDMKPEIDVAKNMLEAFVCVRNQCTLANYSAVTAVANEFHIEEAYEVIATYTEHMEKCHQSVMDKRFARELREEAERMDKHPHFKMTVNLKVYWARDNTYISDFHDLVLHLFGELTRHIHLTCVMEGCIHFVCRAHPMYAAPLAAEARSKLPSMRERGVMWLTIGNETILDLREEMERHEEANALHHGGATVDTSCEPEVHVPVLLPEDGELAPNAEESLENSATVALYPIGCSSGTRVRSPCLPVLVTS